jgi:hypothetical protein
MEKSFRRSRGRIEANEDLVWEGRINSGDEEERGSRRGVRENI